MIYITQIVYVHAGKEQIFHQFEDIAIPIISRYNGKLLLRVRLNREAVIQSALPDSKGTPLTDPYEIHVVSFGTEEDFERFKADEERKSFIHLKEASIREVVLIKGNIL